MTKHSYLLTVILTLALSSNIPAAVGPLKRGASSLLPTAFRSTKSTFQYVPRPANQFTSYIAPKNLTLNASMRMYAQQQTPSQLKPSLWQQCKQWFTKKPVVFAGTIAGGAGGLYTLLQKQPVLAEESSELPQEVSALLELIKADGSNFGKVRSESPEKQEHIDKIYEAAESLSVEDKLKSAQALISLLKSNPTSENAHIINRTLIAIQSGTGASDPRNWSPEDKRKLTILASFRLPKEEQEMDEELKKFDQSLTRGDQKGLESFTYMLQEFWVGLLADLNYTNNIDLYNQGTFIIPGFIVQLLKDVGSHEQIKIKAHEKLAKDKAMLQESIKDAEDHNNQNRVLSTKGEIAIIDALIKLLDDPTPFKGDYLVYQIPEKQSLSEYLWSFVK